jgi:hypothetical protein
VTTIFLKIILESNGIFICSENDFVITLEHLAKKIQNPHLISRPKLRNYRKQYINLTSRWILYNI